VDRIDIAVPPSQIRMRPGSVRHRFFSLMWVR
jgi:hypothetical protein